MVSLKKQKVSKLGGERREEGEKSTQASSNDETDKLHYQCNMWALFGSSVKQIILKILYVRQLEI
jgi:hypothetical protein